MHSGEQVRHTGLVVAGAEFPLLGCACRLRLQTPHLLSALLVIFAAAAAAAAAAAQAAKQPEAQQILSAAKRMVKK